MYVRWQSRKRRTDPPGMQAVHWAAVLVENSRVNGKPVQQHIAYLGGISITGGDFEGDEDDLKYSINQRGVFWLRVFEKLDQLGKRMSVEVRRRIEASVALRVPRPTKAEFTAAVSDWEWEDPAEQQGFLAEIQPSIDRWPKSLSHHKASLISPVVYKRCCQLRACA